METRSFRLVDGTSALASSCAFEEEFAKDRWDAHNIPGLRYAAHTSHYHIWFTIVPVDWRPLIKEYAKYLVAADRTANTIDMRVRQLGHFLHFFSQRYPQATDLHELSTQDVDDFTSWIRADVQRRKLKNSNTYVNHHIQALAGWLSYLERTDHPIKPHLPLPRLIWPHHYPPLDHRSPSSTIKYIPQAVLEQLDRHLHQLTAVYIPVMIVLRASGWRISDVLALKWETCLVLTPDDLPALEAYAQQILERIEIGKQAGNIHWTLVNQKNLDERVRPAIALLKQGHVLASTDKYEREYSDEEWDQRKPHDREEAHE